MFTDLDKLRLKPNFIISTLDLARIKSMMNALSDACNKGVGELHEKLNDSEVVPTQQVPETVVTMNSKVKFMIETTGAEFFLTLVYPKEANVLFDRVSVLSPVGRTVLGLKVGDRIEWTGVNGNKYPVRVIGIQYQPESLGEYHR